jgi:hypothetical protein
MATKITDGQPEGNRKPNVYGTAAAARWQRQSDNLRGLNCGSAHGASDVGRSPDHRAVRHDQGRRGRIGLRVAARSVSAAAFAWP